MVQAFGKHHCKIHVCRNQKCIPRTVLQTRCAEILCDGYIFAFRASCRRRGLKKSISYGAHLTAFSHRGFQKLHPTVKFINRTGQPSRTSCVHECKNTLCKNHAFQHLECIRHTVFRHPKQKTLGDSSSGRLQLICRRRVATISIFRCDLHL